jgi:Fe-S oxidoreductase
MHPHVGRAAVAVLEQAGWGVTIPTQPLCCGLTLISTGQLDAAERVLGRTMRALSDHVGRGGLVVGLEPSCTAVLRSDAVELLADDRDARRVAEQTVTLAELLDRHTPGWEPPRVGDGSLKALVQVHCHQHAVMGWEADRAVLEACCVEAQRIEGGCCGLAGNFGFEPGHLEVSVACAERAMLPAIRAADPGTEIVADGFSCRTQIEQLDSGGRSARHLAELLVEGLGK